MENEKMYCTRKSCGWVGTKDDMANDYDEYYSVYEYHKYCPWCDRSSCIDGIEMRKRKIRNLINNVQ